VGGEGGEVGEAGVGGLDCVFVNGVGFGGVRFDPGGCRF
jgi:hypothetical protein